MRGQFYTPVAEHLKIRGETIEEARVRGVEVWRRGVKVFPSVALGVDNVEENISYITNLNELKYNKSEIKAFPIIKEILNEPVDFRSKDWMDEPLAPKYAKSLGLPEGATLGDFVRSVGEKAEEKSRRIMEYDLGGFPFVGKDGKYYYGLGALKQANEDYNRRYIQYKAKDGTYHSDMEGVRRANVAWYKRMIDVAPKYDYKYPELPKRDKDYILDLGGKGQTELGQTFITKYPPKPELNPQVDKFKPAGSDLMSQNPDFWKENLKSDPNK